MRHCNQFTPTPGNPENPRNLRALGIPETPGALASRGTLKNILSVMLVCLTLGTSVARAALSESQQRDMKLFLSVVAETKLHIDQRREAALSLLRRNWEAGDAALVAMLQPSSAGENGTNAAAMRETQQAIAQALVQSPRQPSNVFVLPLLGLLDSEDDILLADIAEALGRFQDSPWVASQLVLQAMDRKLDVQHRRGSILTLGFHRTRDAAEVLIGLLDKAEPLSIRQIAATALAQLTGIEAYGLHHDLWTQWWESHRDLNDTQWLSSLVSNFARRTTMLARHNEQILQRFVEAQRQLYLGTPQEDRTILLQKMLQDQQLTSRLLAVDLIVQRLIDQQPIDETLRQGVRVALGDTSPLIRQKAAQLIRDLRDESGADAIASRMDREQDVAVLRAYLLAMADMPRARALRRAMRLLGNDQFKDQAAGLLERAIGDGMLKQRHRSALTEQLRQLTAGDQPPSPKMIELLGRVGTKEDWLRIAQWLDSKDDTVRTAAAEAWAASDRPLEELAKRADQPLFASIFLRAAVRRGNNEATLLAIAEHHPQQEQLQEAWLQALIATASRVQSPSIIKMDQTLAANPDMLSIREQLLTDLIGKLNGHADPALLLTRAAVRLQTEQTIQAMADLTLAEAKKQELTAEQLDHLRQLTIQAALAIDQFDKAIAATKDWLGILGNDAKDRAARAEQLMPWFTAWTQQAITAKRYESAAQGLSQYRALVAPLLSKIATEQLDHLGATLQKAIQEAAPPTPPTTTPTDETQASNDAS